MRLELVPEASVAHIITADLAYTAVRAAFISVWRRDAALFPVLAGRSFAEGTAVNVKFGFDRAHGTVGLKVGTFWPTNAGQGLPNHGATTLLLNAATGFPMAVIAASLLNRFRTAAANAVAVDALARPDAHRLAVIGTGRQAEYEVRAVAAVRALSAIHIGARTPERGEALRARLGDLGLPITVQPVDEAVAAADIVTTITTSRAPLFKADVVQPGTHISAMGADAVGKQELDPALVAAADFFADDPDQSAAIGEAQHNVAAPAGQHPVAIGAVLAGDHAGRRSAAAITVFDSSGLAAQDLQVASAILDRARQLDLCRVIEF